MEMESIRIKHKIHVAAEQLDVSAIWRLLQHDPTLVNRRFIDLTPFHIVADSLTLDKYDRVFEVIKILIKYKADINSIASDSSFHTPFSQLLDKLIESKDKRGAQLLEFIIDSYDRIDIDNREGETRELLAEAFPELFSRIAANYRPDDFDASDGRKVLDKLKGLMFDDERIFIRTVERLAGDPQFTTILKDLLDDLLRTAVEEGLLSCVRKLLGMGARVDIDGPGQIRTLIGLACQKGFWEILMVLAAVEGVFDKTDPLLSIVIKNMGTKRLNQSSDYDKCFNFLVDHKQVNPNARDMWNNTALHYAVRYKNEQAIKTLLGKKAYIGAGNEFDALPIRDMDPDVLEQYFDSCITTNGERPGDDQYEVRFDYSCLVPPEPQQRELVPVQYMANAKELRHLVQHPLITSFLFLKWMRLSAVFYLNLAAFLIYSIPLVVYILFRPTTGTFAAVLLQSLIIFGTIYLLTREIFQLLVAPRNFVKSITNWLELVLIGSTVYILHVSMNPSRTETLLHIFYPITIIFVAVELLMLVGSLPFFTISTYMVMLKTVTKSFLRGLLLYSIILVAFALSFYTLFSFTMTRDSASQNSTDTQDADTEAELNRFTSPALALVKTMVMMTGEFDAGSIEFNQNPLSYYIFVVFVFFISMVVWNLLNGLAVSDTQLIKSEATLNNWLERVLILSVFENILLGTNRNVFRDFFMEHFPKWPAINLFPKFLPLHTISIKPNESPPNQIYIPGLPAKKRHASVEYGEASPLVPSTDALNCCGLFGKCKAMDRNIVKQAISSLAKRDKEQKIEAERVQMKMQISEIEAMLKELLRKS